MNLLLDTHYVFAIAGSPGRLTGMEINFLAAHPDRFVVSVVSIWEMRLKWDVLHASGDRKGPLDPAQAMQILAGQNIDFLPFSATHAATPLREPISHGDPFDEILLVQAQVEGLKLLTRDARLLRHSLAARAAPDPR
jgi:PIN domain nuclease of toxin-antitoxin system